jgi:hypothetical protein
VNLHQITMRYIPEDRNFIIQGIKAHFDSWRFLPPSRILFISAFITFEQILINVTMYSVCVWGGGVLFEYCTRERKAYVFLFVQLSRSKKIFMLYLVTLSNPDI